MIKKVLIIVCMFFVCYSNAQMVVREIKAIYKSKIDGKIISEKEFQSYRGRHIFHKYIKAKKGGKDTILISPPKDITKAKAKKFESLNGSSIRDFQVVDIYGETFNSSQLKGKTIVMNFWFVACPPCIQEIPALNDLVKKYENNNNIVFLAFSRDTQKYLGNFLSKTEFNYSIIPSAKKVIKDYNIYAFPSHVIVNKNGKITYTSVGFENGNINNLTKAIEKTILKD